MVVQLWYMTKSCSVSIHILSFIIILPLLLTAATPGTIFPTHLTSPTLTPLTSAKDDLQKRPARGVDLVQIYHPQKAPHAVSYNNLLCDDQQLSL